MARRFKRKRSFRRRTRRKRVFRRRPRMFRNARPEIKRITIQGAAQVVNNVTGLTAVLTDTAQGLLSSNRIGLQIRPIMLQLNMCWSSNAESCVRWGIVRFKANAGAHPFSILELLAGNPSNRDSLSQRNFTFRHTYKQIAGSKFTMNPLAGSDTKKRMMSLNLKLKGKCYYNSTGLGNEGYGHYFFYAISDIPSPATVPQLDFSARIFYVDN